MMGLLAFCNPNFILLDFKGGEMFKFFLILYPAKAPIDNLSEWNPNSFY
jgi:hypothetical protein